MRNYIKIGVAGPVGSGKTALIERLTRQIAGQYSVAVITNDIYTQEDAEFLPKQPVAARVHYGRGNRRAAPHTAIREDASMNLEAVDEMAARFPDVEIVFIESGGDNLSATFSPHLADVTIFVIDVAQGEKIPRKGGPGITRSDLLVINKTDLAPHVGASLDVMGTRCTAHAARPAFCVYQFDERRKSGRSNRLDTEIRAAGRCGRTGGIGALMFTPKAV